MDICAASCDDQGGVLETADEERLRIVVSLGLSTWEARAYLAALDLGEAKASVIADEALIPRGRVYDVLKRLHAEGVVDIIPTIPRRFRGVPPERLIQQRQFELRLQAEALKGMAEVLAPRPPRRGSKPAQARIQMALVQGRRAAVSKFRELVDGAAREIIEYTSEACVNRQAKFAIPLYRTKAKEGVTIRLVVSVTKNNLSAVKALERNVEVRHHPLGNRVLTALVADETRGLLIHWAPDDDDLVRGNDIGIASEDPGFSESLRTAVVEHWEHGAETAGRYRELKDETASADS